jgi:hypothetical protein
MADKDTDKYAELKQLGVLGMLISSCTRNTGATISRSADGYRRRFPRRND